METIATIKMYAITAAFIVYAAAVLVYALWRYSKGGRSFKAIFAVTALITAALAFPTAREKLRRSKFYVDDFLRDNGSYTTNDVVYVDIIKNPILAEVELSDCPVLVYAREFDSTNTEDFVEISTDISLGLYPQEFQLAGATNYDFWVFLDYTPPPTVHTNGVWQAQMFEMPGAENTFAFPRSTFELEEDEEDEENEEGELQ